MNNSSDNTSRTALESAVQMQEQSKKSLHEFFQNKHIKDLGGVLVPSIIALTLFPFFGHALAVIPGVIAIQNSLKMVGISLSSDTIQKLLQLFQGNPMGEDDMKEAIKELLPIDKKVNDEAAKALVVVTPAVKEAALANPKLDTKWLGESLEINLKEQGETMAKIASEIRELIQRDEKSLEAGLQHLLNDWSSVTQEATARKYSKVADTVQSAEGKARVINQKVTVEDHSEITGTKQNVKLT